MAVLSGRLPYDFANPATPIHTHRAIVAPKVQRQHSPGQVAVSNASNDVALGFRRNKAVGRVCDVQNSGPLPRPKSARTTPKSACARFGLRNPHTMANQHSAALIVSRIPGRHKRSFHSRCLPWARLWLSFPGRLPYDFANPATPIHTHRAIVAPKVQRQHSPGQVAVSNASNDVALGFRRNKAVGRVCDVQDSGPLPRPKSARPTPKFAFARFGLGNPHTMANQHSAALIVSRIPGRRKRSFHSPCLPWATLWLPFQGGYGTTSQIPLPRFTRTVR